MKRVFLLTVLALVAHSPLAAPGSSLTDRFIEVAVEHIKAEGPDSDVAQFVSMYADIVRPRRAEFFDLVLPYLKSKDGEKVAGAIEVLYRLRNLRLMQDLGHYEQDYSRFIAQVDEEIYKELDYFQSLENDDVRRQLALYLGCSPTAVAKEHLLRIAENPAAKDAKEQALICLAWHNDPQDMDALFPFMLEDSRAARSLPYHFRNSYGKAAIPYLTEALSKAHSKRTKLEAAFQLVHLRVPDGFGYLHDLALENPPAENKHSPPIERIRQFVIDYLVMPANVRSPEAIAAHLASKKIELCESRSDNR